MQQVHQLFIVSIIFFILSRMVLNIKRRKLNDFNEIISNLNIGIIICVIISALFIADFILLLTAGITNLLVILLFLLNISECLVYIKEKKTYIDNKEEFEKN